MNGRYILDANGEPVPCQDLMAWARWLENGGDRRVALTPVGEGRISTVFLGLDHAFGDGPPVLWETMAFDIPGLDGEQERYTSLADAKAGHEAMVARALELTQAAQVLQPDPSLHRWTGPRPEAVRDADGQVLIDPDAKTFD